jgi:pyruvate carboxylase
MLLRASNAVGYTNYADNVVRYFVGQAAKNGVDVFRVFDSLNWVENMRVAIDAVRESGALCEGAICYTADLFDDSRKYGLNYYLGIARDLQKAGVHVLGVKDMAGLARPRAIRELVRALKAETGLPIHFHTHDTSGAAAASVLAAVEAGVDAVDGALDAMSGLTSQPNLSAIVAALAGDARDPCVVDGRPAGVDLASMQSLSHYWEGVRRIYAPFESDIRAGTADVYNHEMPGGQYTNLREQARAVGLEHRWPEVSRAYAEVNRLFGDIVKVTPTSKVVGDLALFMVANDLTPADVTDPRREIAFPESVVSLFRGELGFPPDGFPAALSRKVLKSEPPVPYRPGDTLPEVDLDAARRDAEKVAGHQISDTDLASYLMYPKVFKEYAEHHRQYSDVSVLPTQTFFYGMAEREEIAIDIDQGKTLVVRMQGTAPSDEEGVVKVFFELNGQARAMRVDKAGAKTAPKRALADPTNPGHVPAPMPGMIVTVAVKPGQSVKAGDPLISIEAMKMETQIRAERDGVVRAVHVKSGDTIGARDLLLEVSP